MSNSPMDEKVRQSHVIAIHFLADIRVKRPYPDITPLLKPTTLGDIATYTFFSAAGIFVGGETGLLTGVYSARRTISSDPAAKARIEKAFRRFRVDVLRKQIQVLEAGQSETIWN